MKQNKQSKLVAILALCVSVVGLTLGFAAFSNTLTISSSATVSPNESDFDINVYGMDEETACDNNRTLESFTSTDKSVPDCVSTAKSATISEIKDDGKSITISNINIGFSAPGEYAYYYYIIKNEGEYDAYIDTAQFSPFDYSAGGAPKTCTAATETNVDMVNNACSDIILSADITGIKGENFVDVTESSVYQLGKGESILLEMGIEYNEDGERADGDFSVEFDPITIEFTSVPPAE